jgi:hypothetical protein
MYLRDARQLKPPATMYERQFRPACGASIGPVTGCYCAMCERLREARGELTQCRPDMERPKR